MTTYKRKIISKEFIKQFLPENPIIIEAGAHKGRDTIKMAKLWPKAKIYAFEPIKSIYKILKESTKEYTNIYCYNLALSNKSGKADIYESSGTSDAASSLLTPTNYLKEQPTVFFKKQETDIITLDSWCKNNKINHIDFMWLDMQGFELQMLKFAGDILKTVKAIHTEVNLTERYENCTLYPEYKKWLESHGFVLVKEDIFKPTWGNALFIKH